MFYGDPSGEKVEPAYILSKTKLIEEVTSAFTANNKNFRETWKAYKDSKLTKILTKLVHPFRGFIQNLYNLGALSVTFWPGGNKESGTNRFVYTCKCGWIDTGHFFNMATAAYATHSETVAGIGGKVVELTQWLSQKLGIKGDWGASAYTREDLSSNAYGAKFGKELEALTTEVISAKFTQFLEDCQCVEFDPVDEIYKKQLDNLPVGIPQGQVKGWYLWRDAQKGLGTSYSDTPVKTPSHNCVCPKEEKEGGK